MMRNKFAGINQSIKELQSSVKIQKEAEDVARMNLMKQIDEKGIILEKVI